MGPFPHRSLAALSNKHGPLMLLQLGQIPTLVISSAEILQEIIETQDANFSDRPSLIVPNKLLYGCKDVAFAPYGDHWRNVRKLIVFHLLSPPRIRSYHLIREQEVASMIDNIMNLSSLGLVVDLTGAITVFAKEVASMIVFNKRSSEEGWNEMADVLLKDTNDLLVSFQIGDYFPRLSWLSSLIGFDARLERTCSTVNKIIERIIEDRRISNSQPIGCGSKLDCFVDILLSLEKDGKNYLDKDSVKALTELEWAMAELVRNPEAMKKLQNELRSKLGPKAIITNEELVGMGYLKSVIKETLRLHTPGPLLGPRRVLQNTIVRGYEIPKRTRVIINAWDVSRDAGYWEAPGEFRPERFLNGLTDMKGRDFHFIPFGVGRRACTGKHFAISIVEVALANLVYRFDWELPDGMRREDMDMGEAPGFTVRKRVNLRLLATPCSYSQE
ncbi:uncharacterized protein A4U43_C04F31940 [Asparagus officinalis]|uniref:Cytochrome P450 n=2 Tax=Asparagus officinalis TaxID=4686 RepID=A0A5P1F523_ASPOF|nr:uncharacterized protein A4U43_C04F31940 [Asparagus officinalis]